MKGIPGRVTSGLPTQARLDCVDNTGAKVVQLITVLNKGGVARRYPSAGVGDMVRVTVRRGTPETRREGRICKHICIEFFCSLNFFEHKTTTCIAFQLQNA